MPNIATNSLIANRIREARQYLDVPVEELAQMLAIRSENLEEIERGETVISAALLNQISKTLGRSLEYFTGEIPAQKASSRTEFLARAAETLSDQDIGELQRFATYLRSRSEDAKV